MRASLICDDQVSRPTTTRTMICYANRVGHLLMAQLIRHIWIGDKPRSISSGSDVYTTKKRRVLSSVLNVLNLSLKG